MVLDGKKKEEEEEEEEEEVDSPHDMVVRVPGICRKKRNTADQISALFTFSN